MSSSIVSGPGLEERVAIQIYRGDRTYSKADLSSTLTISGHFASRIVSRRRLLRVRNSRFRGCGHDTMLSTSTVLVGYCESRKEGSAQSQYTRYTRDNRSDTERSQCSESGEGEHAEQSLRVKDDSGT